MEQPEQNDLFEIRLTPWGKYYIRRFAAIARMIILAGILISFIHIASTVIGYIIFKPSQYAGYKYLLLENRLMPYYMALYCMLFYPQMYFYWQATKYLKRSLDFNDEDAFNKSFRSLFRSSVFGIASVLLSLLSYGAELFIYIIYYL